MTRWYRTPDGTDLYRRYQRLIQLSHHAGRGAKVISVSSFCTASTIRFDTNSAEWAGGRFLRSKAGAGTSWLPNAFFPKLVAVKYGSTTRTLIASFTSSALA